MKKIKKMLLILLSIVLVIELAMPTMKSEAKNKNITIEEYIQKLVVATKIKVDNTVENPYLSAAIAEGLVKDGEYKNYSVNIKREDAALLTNRADEILHGKTYNEDLYHQVKNKKRIKDLNKVSASKRDAVIKVFEKGIIVGDYDGIFTHDRTFRGKDNLNSSEASTILVRLTNKKKRRKISPDGQVIRTTNLPKNYKNYEYILASFPNSFYEMKMDWQLGSYFNDNGRKRKPVEYKDYVRPVNIKKKKFITGANDDKYNMEDILNAYLDQWVNKVKTNLETRLNVDYRTVGTKWINKLRGTYYIFDFGDSDDAFQNKRRTDDIKEYVKVMKKNKVIIKSSIVSVEPSTLYDAGGYFIRACIRFKVVSAKNMSNKANLIFGDNYIKNLKKGKWKTMYVDIGIGTQNGSSLGEDYAVYEDDIMTR
ncbi:hypothetical protein [Anaeromicropila herbilytica]|uniref:SLH domain-containing protein n=1 Tax=Anaeromicropila herbilytica TaxID=2785025 RepID=A0A7R7EP91_9FIRM|nr:hypothetical protein [Anaeromicropila herbilytica]BCN32399.1 hypothetical protein bsdtb5_36940 [Anaeromicropila herbilytica]